MRSVLFLAFLQAGCYCIAQTNPPLPTFTSSDILNAASGLPDSYSPYGLISIHGSNLSLQTVSINFDDNRTEVPVVIANGGTRVWIRNMPVGLLYVSPDQIVCLPPADIALGPASIFVTVASLASQTSQIFFRRTAPALFLQLDGVAAASQAESGANISPDSPASPGDSIVLYATGLGPTRPNPVGFTVLRRLAPVSSPMRVLLDGVELPATGIDYAGMQPGLAGTYQIRMRLPTDVASNPEVRVEADGVLSPEAIRIPVRWPDAAAAMTTQRSRKLLRSASLTRGSPGATWSRRPLRIQLSSSSTSE